MAQLWVCMLDAPNKSIAYSTSSNVASLTTANRVHLIVAALLLVNCGVGKTTMG